MSAALDDDTDEFADDSNEADDEPSLHAHTSVEAENCPVKISVHHWNQATITIGQSPDWTDIAVDQATMQRLAVASKVALVEMTSPDDSDLPDEMAWLASRSRTHNRTASG